MKVQLTFTEPLLGTLSGNREVAQEFILSKRPDGMSKDEREALSKEEHLEHNATIFASDNGRFLLWDYQLKGFFKEAAEAMIDMEKINQETLKNVRLTRYMYKKTIDKLVFVKPRRIYLDLAGEMSFCERPLRGQTMKGERIALAYSQQAPAGTQISFDVIAMNPALDDYIKSWLRFGRLYGLGQWRNSGKGRFTVKIED